MRASFNRILAILLAVIMTISLAACGRDRGDDSNEISESTGGKDLVRAEAADHVFSMNTNPKYSLNPFIATNHSNQLVDCLVYENMVEVDNDFNVIPNVISSWSCNDDATLWTLVLDTETPHTFSDGEPVSGRDLVYSIGNAIYNDHYRGRFNSFQGASYTDEGMQVSLGIGDSQFIKLLNIPVIKLGTYDQGGGVPPIGSGPYMFNEDYTELLANPNYPNYKKLPVDTIYLTELTDAESALTAFEDGTIDVVINDPSSYTSLGYASSNEIHNYATTNMHYLMFNEESTLGKQNVFRVALQYAFDRDYLVDLLGGNAEPSPIPLYPTVSYYPTELANALRYNLDTCKAVLSSAGVSDWDDDGKLELMSGNVQEIELHLIVCADSSAKAGICNRFANDMKSLGLNVVVHELTWADYMLALEEGSLEVAGRTVVWDMYYGEVKLRNNFDLTELLQVRNEDNERSNLNYSRSRDTTYETRIRNYLSAASEAIRASFYYDLCDYLTRTSGDIITIGFEKQQIITRRGVVKGLNANMGNPLYDCPNWTIDLS